eukprot:TRINITY_DN13883_c0_g1_i1.p1 TRINITY_DN13883_c0_g1~~TRINITY_DN13883_c0_g1_i1.p1  ORF type:complete len:52 (-),score=8.24 TRINITY_DN13883_c0_g1_i1:336-491(-)
MRNCTANTKKRIFAVLRHEHTIIDFGSKNDRFQDAGENSTSFQQHKISCGI